MDDQKIQLKFEADTLDIAKARAALIATEAETRKLEAAQASLRDEMAAVAKSARDAGENPAAIKGFQMAARQYKENEDRLEQLRKTTARASGGVAGMGQSMLQTGRVIQDFSQGGIGGVLNNIEGLTMALGLSGGLAGALTIVGVGFMLLQPKIRELFNSFDSTKLHEVKDGIKAIEERIKVLSDKPFKFKVEAKELDDLQKQLDKVKKAINEYNALMSKQTEFEAKSGRQVEEAILELPRGQKDVEKAKQAYMDQAVAKPESQAKLGYFDDQQAKMQKRYESVQKTIDIRAAAGQDISGQTEIAKGLKEAMKDMQAQKENAETNIRLNAGEQFDQTVSTAKSGKGEDQLREQQTLAAWLKQVGAKDLAEAIEQSSPQAVQANEEGQEEFDASVNKAVESGKRATQGNKQRRKRAAAASDQELEDFTAGEQSRLDRTNAKREQANRAAQGIAKMYGGGVLGEDVGKAIAGGMDQAKVEENIQVVLAREGVDKSLQSKVARAMIANARQDIAQQRALNPVGDPNGVMPGQRPKRFVGKRNRALAEKKATRKWNDARPQRAALGMKPFVPPAIPSIGKMPELKIGGDNDKTVQLQRETVGLLKRLVASNDEMARKSNIAILG